MPCDAETLRTLADAGCGVPMIRRYEELEERAEPGSRRQQERLLLEYRETLLASLRETEFRLGCLDYLRFRQRADGRPSPAPKKKGRNEP